MLIMAAVLILTPALVIWAYRANSAARVQRILDEARREGAPTNADDVAALYSLPPDQTDTAPLWMAATAPLARPSYNAAANPLPIVGTSSNPVPPADQPWSQQAAVEQHLADCGESLRLMHEAAKIGGPGRYPTDFSKGYAMPLPHAQALRTAARLLELEARVRARQGDAHGAAESLHAIFQAAASLEREPILVSQLVRYACYASGVSLLQDLLPQVELSDEDLARLQDDLEAADFQPSLRRAVQAERVLGAMAFHDSELLKLEIGRAAATASAVTRQDDLTAYLESMRRFEAAAAKPWPDAMQEVQAIGDDFRAANGSLIGQARYLLTARILPGMESAFQATFRTQARNRIAAAALAVERHRAKYGQTPASLEQTAPEFLTAVPSDPFDGKPLRYFRVGDDGYTLYSIGSNGIDDGGQEQENRGEPDVTFRVERRGEK
jgi:hypothetical protein